MKYVVAIDLVSEDFDENKPILESPKFNTEEEADAWYRSLNIDERELNSVGAGLDIIMIIYDNEGKIADTYLIA